MDTDKPVKLNPRLKAVARLVIPGEPVADIGSDHGYLPIYLVSRGIVPSAVAVEVSPGPWARADRQVRLYGMEGEIQVRLGDGLQPIRPGEVATAVLAGMGTQTIIRILAEAGPVVRSLKRLVLQPMVEVPLLRKWLYEQGLHLTQEELVQEGHRYYVVLAAEKGIKPMPSAMELELGPLLMANKHPLLKEYMLQVLRQDEALLAELKQFDSEKALRQRQLLEKRLKEWKEVMRWLFPAEP
ncbi:MAG: SAM-dependent methyltransferase [Clostridia bacterium]|nr:SAM-dependent methyltransferase [Clostridia bacterium]